MPYAKSSTRARWGAVMAGAVPALFGAPAVAQAACPTAVNPKPFQRFGDYADYSLAPGGGFESGSAGWAVRERVLFGQRLRDQLGELWIHGVDVALTPVALVAALEVEQRPWTVLAMRPRTKVAGRSREPQACLARSRAARSQGQRARQPRPHTRPHCPSPPSGPPVAASRPWTWTRAAGSRPRSSALLKLTR